MKFIDAHSHIQDKAYDADRGDVIVRMREGAVSTIVVGTDKKMSEDAVSLAETNDFYATVGQHPTDIPDEIFDYDFYKQLAQNPKVVGIGECGIDYFRLRVEGGMLEQEKKRQRELFENHIKLATEIKKPLMIHGRPSHGTQDAYEDILNLLQSSIESLPLSPGNVHFFAGNRDTAQKFLKLGFTLSFTGVITFTHDYDDVIRDTPLDMILIETDAPYVSPVPHRGKRNEPIFVIEVANRIASIKNESIEKVAEEIYENTRRVFKI